MSEMTILGFDYGKRWIGVAIGETITKQARPLTTLQIKHKKLPWQEIDALVQQWQPDAIVVGLPINMDGTEQPLTKVAERFCQQLQSKYMQPVFRVDERLTTVEAREQIFAEKGYRGLQKPDIDSYAAKLIVEAWLQNHNE